MSKMGCVGRPSGGWLANLSGRHGRFPSFVGFVRTSGRLFRPSGQILSGPTANITLYNPGSYLRTINMNPAFASFSASFGSSTPDRVQCTGTAFHSRVTFHTYRPSQPILHRSSLNFFLVIPRNMLYCMNFLSEL